MFYFGIKTYMKKVNISKDSHSSSYFLEWLKHFFSIQYSWISKIFLGKKKESKKFLKIFY